MTAHRAAPIAEAALSDFKKGGNVGVAVQEAENAGGM